MGFLSMSKYRGYMTTYVLLIGPSEATRRSVNLYGRTESTVATIIHTMPRPDQPVPKLYRVPY